MVELFHSVGGGESPTLRLPPQAMVSSAPDPGAERFPVSDIRIHPLSSERRDINRFLRVPYLLYRNNPYWVAPLIFDARKVLDRSNPFFQHAQMQLWVAESEGVDVGRI